MNKTFKYLLLLAAVTIGAGTLTSCSDDDLPAADALFRPVITENDNVEHGLDANLLPYVIITWDNYSSANQYTLKLEAIDGTDSREVQTSGQEYTFTELQYDTEYNISLSAANTETHLSSKAFSLTTTSLDYPTSLSTPGSSDLIDTQARIKWAEGTSYDQLLLYKDSNDSLLVDTLISDAINADASLIFKNLSPKTTYRIVAYQSGEYRGKKRFTTTAAESYDGKVIDLRGMEGGESYITTEQIAADVAENPDEDLTYVLEGGTLYKISGGTQLPATTKSIRFVTGLTLAGNAIFRQTGGFSMVPDVEINAVTFEKIDFISDKAQEGGDNEIATNTDKGFGGRQVFNVNGTKSTLHTLSFISCTMQGYRAMVRAQKATDAVQNIVVEDCVINGIGDQGVFTTTNTAADWQTVTLKNSTITNIVMLCDFRKSKDKLKFTIENCTFCYAPMETTANANTPMFRLGDGNVVLTVKSTLFGPSMNTTDAEGSEVHTYTAGTVGSIFLSGTPDNLVVEDSYKTDFTWTDRGTETPVTNPLEGLGELGISETALWSAPSTGNFAIVGKVQGVDLGKLGDARWW